MEVVEPVTNTISEGQEYLRNPKARLYAGQVICSKNYKDFTPKERLFWQKAYRAFRQGKFYFEIDKQQFVVPFRLADGSFDSVQTVGNLNQKITEGKKLKEDVEAAKAEKEIQNSVEIDSIKNQES